MDAGTRLERARSAHVRGRALMAGGKPQRARDLLVRALDSVDALPDTRERAEVRSRIAITLALAELELRGWRAATERLAAVAVLVEEHGLEELRISLQNQRGCVALRAGRFAEAAAEFEAASPYLAAAPANERCYVLLNRSVVNMELGRLSAAAADLRACADSARAADLPLLARMATHNLGYVAFLAGDLPRALGLMEAAVALDAAASPATVLLARAQVLVEAGLFREADDTLASAAAVFRADRLGRDVAEVELERARCALALDDPVGARRFASSSARRFRRLDSQTFERAAELVRLQADLADRRAPARVAEQARLAYEELAAAGVRLPARAAALTGIEASLAAGRPDTAAAWWAEIGPARRTDPITGRMHSARVAAELAAADGRTSAASRIARRALDDLTRYQVTFGSIDLRTASAVHGRHLAALDIDLALRSGRAEAVFVAAERARAMSLRLPAVRPPGDAVAAEQLAELRRTVEALRPVEQDPRASAPLLRRRRELEREVTARSWVRSGSGEVERPVTTAEVRELLGSPGRSMVTFVQAGGRLAAVSIDGRPRLHDLGPVEPVLERVRRIRADLDVLAGAALPAAMRAAVRSSLQRSLDAVDKALIAPVRLADSVVVVSTGLLGQVPWASLPSMAGRPVTVTSSATTWGRAARIGGTSTGGLVAVAGPGLERSGHEARAVAAAWPRGTYLDDGDATGSAFRDAVGSASVVHVAAHGVHQPENPLFSSVRMVDGPVFAHELDPGARAPDHVVLSACEVGLATVRPGDEALGLASALLRLGTHSVVAGVARVGDEVAERTMVDYHHRLAAGTDSAEALADALAAVDSDVRPPFVHFGAGWHAPDLAASGPVA